MIAERIERFVRGDGTDSFADLAAAAAAHQRERCAAIRRLDGRRSGAHGDGWRATPLVPTLAFKTQTLAVAEAVEVFHSSGTTSQTTSVHHHPFPSIYRAVIDVTFPPGCLAGLDRPPFLSLVPSRDEAPRSSLAFMIDHALARFGGDGSRTVFRRGRVDVGAARGALAARQRDGRPTLIVATALALLDLLDGLDRLDLSFRLPPGSRLFETGGTKGRRRSIERPELVAAVERRLGVPAAAIVREYGMTELTTHFYAGSLPHDDRDLFAVPPWARVRALDPLTLEEARPGEEGLLAIFDLANVGSALHVLTEDTGRVEAGGFRLTGRARGAELRGCSLLAESLAERSS